MSRDGVALVTDSTASLNAAAALAAGVEVVALRLQLADRAGLEGVDIGTEEVNRALQAREAVTTSRPTPEDFCLTYERCLTGGAGQVVSVHLSSALSGTYDAARLAAARFDGRVTVLDSRSIGMVLGCAVLRAAAAAHSGGDVTAIAAIVTDTVRRSTLLFYVSSMEWLRRGGRIGPATARLGTALSVRPLLQLRDGSIVVAEKVRTTSRAIARLEELAAAAIPSGVGDVAVHHLDAAERAGEVAARLAARLGSGVTVQVSEASAAIAAHVGPGLLGIAVCPG